MLYFVKLGKDRSERCRAFPERVGPRILSLESVDYLVTSEYFGKNFDGEAINCSKLSLYANESRDEHAVYFRR